MLKVKVGNEYERKIGKNVSIARVTAIGDKKTTLVMVKSGKEFEVKNETLQSWKRTYLAGSVRHDKRLNTKSCADVIVAVLKKTKRPMTAKELVAYMKKSKMFIFKTTALTPWNSVSTRANQYIAKMGDEAEIKKAEGLRGKFVHTAWVAPVEEPVAEAVETPTEPTEEPVAETPAETPTAETTEAPVEATETTEAAA